MILGDIDVRLTEVFRQFAESRIIINAHRLNQRLMPDLASPDGDSAIARAETIRKLGAVGVYGRNTRASGSSSSG